MADVLHPALIDPRLDSRAVTFENQTGARGAGGTAHGGRAAYAVGYTGLGVVSTRFGARVALDLLDGRETEATRLRYVRSKPVPFPPEPLRSAVIQLTRNRLDAADRNAGRRGLWLRTLDRLGLAGASPEQIKFYVETGVAPA